MHHSINGLPLYFHETAGVVLQNDQGQHILVFCLHGYLDHGVSFKDLLTHLGWEAIAWDARGFGQSAWIPAYDYYHFYDYVRDLHASIQAQLRLTPNLSEDTQVLLIGHSMGGMIASLYAGIYPEKIAGLVNLEGWMITDTPPEQVPERLRQWLEQCGEVSDIRPFARYKTREEALTRMHRQDALLTPEQLQQLSDPILKQDDAGYFWGHDPLHRTRSPQPFRLDQAQACWQAIRAPQLLIYGAQSSILELPDWQQRMDSFGVNDAQRDATLVAVPDAGHNLHLHQSKSIAETIQSWLRTRPQFKHLPFS